MILCPLRSSLKLELSERNADQARLPDFSYLERNACLSER